MRIKYCLCVLLACWAGAASAQKANYELAEKCLSMPLPWNYGEITPFFVPDSDDFWYKNLTSDGEMYYFVDVKAGTVTELFDREKLAAEMSAVTGREYDPKRLGFWGIPFDKDGVTLRWGDGSVRFAYNRLTGELTHTDAAADARQADAPAAPAFPSAMRMQAQGVSPDGRYQVFGRDHNVYLRDLRDSSVTQLTFDGEPGFSYTFDAPIGMEVAVVPVWFDDSQNFYLTRDDTRRMGVVYDMDYLRGRPTAYPDKVVLAGDSVVLSTEISLFNVADKRQKKVAIRKWQDQWTRVIHRDTRSNKFYVERKNRRSTVLEICEVDAATASVRVLIHEEELPYIPIELASIHFLPESGDIVWWSERTGYGHLYRYGADGRLKNAITSGDWTVGKVLRIDEKKGEIYFEAYGFTPGENPSYAKIAKASLDGRGKVTLLTPDEATHAAVFSPSGRYLIDVYSRPDLPARYAVRDTRGRLVVELPPMDISRWLEAGWRLPETFSVKAADGATDLYGVMWKPFDFDSTRRYPVISCVYPGPQTDHVPLSFEVASENEALAQLGFVVVAFNHRGGVPYRGRDYHAYGYDDIRDHALADDKAGLEQLIARHPFIDGSRVGVYGHSGGGMMSTAAICTYPDFYKACVSSAGNHDNNIYTQFFVENHYAIDETPRSVVDTLRAADGRDSLVTRRDTVFSVNLPTNMELARNLKGHLMLVVGGLDGNVHPANTFRMVDAFLNCGKDIEFVYLPRAGHTYEGVAEWYFRHKLWSHFAKYLLGDFTSSGFYDIEEDPNTFRVKKFNSK